MSMWHPAPVLRTDIMAMFEEVAPELTINWAHKLTFVSVKGKTKYVCSCGKQGRKWDDAADARKEYEKHVGLKQQKR